MPSDHTKVEFSISAQPVAKINLTLDVLGKRDDGFHSLRSLVCGVGIADELDCSLEGDENLRVECNGADLGGEDNLVFRAARAMTEHLGSSPNTTIRLTKRIPIGAGLGGGSSDAASTLSLLNELWRANLPQTELERIGASIGSDVPLFLSLPSAIMTGRGEHVEQISMKWSGWATVVFAGEFVSTPKVYGCWSPADCRNMPTNKAREIAEESSAAGITSLSSNHLEPAVFRTSPTVARVYDDLIDLGIGPVRVSGAGSALYMLFDDIEEAQSVERLVRRKGIGESIAIARVPTSRPSDTREELIDGDLGNSCQTR